MSVEHANLTSIHRMSYVQTSDPGSVGAFKGWVDTNFTPFRLKVRNSGNTAWVDVGIWDSDIITIAGLTPTNDDILQYKSGAWTNRTVANVKSDLALNNVPNVDSRPRSTHTGTQTASTISDFNSAVHTVVDDVFSNLEGSLYVTYSAVWDLSNLADFTVMTVPVDKRFVLVDLIFEKRNGNIAGMGTSRTFYFATSGGTVLYHFDDFKAGLANTHSIVHLTAPLDGKQSTTTSIILTPNDDAYTAEINVHAVGILIDSAVFDD